MKDVLVTGGTGFVGTGFVDQVLSHHPDLHITVVDNGNANFNRRNARYLRDKYSDRLQLLDVDIRDRDELENVFSRNRFDTVVNLAAVGSNWRAHDDPHKAYQTNVDGTINVYKLA